MKLGLIFSAMILVAGCSVATPSGCPGSDLPCGNACYDPSHYACENGQIVLTSCDQGYQLCGHGCVPFPSECCANGHSCYASVCASNNTCIPVGATDCGNGRYCPFGHSCLNGGANCT